MDCPLREFLGILGRTIYCIEVGDRPLEFFQSFNLPPLDEWWCYIKEGGALANLKWKPPPGHPKAFRLTAPFA